MPSDIDRLFALKALEKRVKAEREEVEAEVRETLLSQYAESGNDRMRSPYFGNEAGAYTYIPPKEEERTEWDLADHGLFLEWLGRNQGAAESYAAAFPLAFAEWWFGETGEVPDGAARACIRCTKPGSTRLAVKEHVVMGKLGANFLEEANRLLLEGGEDA